MESPKKKSGGAIARATRSESPSGILSSTGYSVNHTRAQWQKEAARLWSEYQRTGDRKHLTAFHVHRAAMGGRLHAKAANL
ncbi:MAG: hypothetical protein JO354_05400 [Verrucomicrobia bacterium]|nr:hypothetical protein [Verrucomicrobiota bacterium]